ncbi:hypothetical protein NLI96_g80 [Meripilus lineatus]|uniref:Uncharacterized protein n=1 Tax=Meripilus lineatus TaxID=2056292 RepID=A0AAD5VFH0_9APHY|nr:hypothetical protein NLI96_g80 [Physisporinus lineatus]
MSSDSSHDSHIQPLQFKGEIMDFDIDEGTGPPSPALTATHPNASLSRFPRDDPNVDENTRLRNRIAELESLVRELRGTTNLFLNRISKPNNTSSGKPHPRWAEPNFCDGDATEKWHSRSSRRTQAQFARQRREFQENNGQIDGANATPVVKVEQDASQRHLYRLSQSPPSLNGHTHNSGNCSPSDNSSLCSYPSSSNSNVEYNHNRQNGTPSLGMSNNNDLYYHQPYIRPSDPSPVQPSCTCLTNPAAGHPLIALTHQLQTTMDMMRQLPEHNNRNQCLIMKRITDLNDMMHGGNAGEQQPQPQPTQQFDGLPTPTETELLSPVSASSHSSIGNTLQQEWPTMTATQTAHYDNYFPAVGAGEQGVYHHKTYHIN